MEYFIETECGPEYGKDLSSGWKLDAKSEKNQKEWDEFWLNHSNIPSQRRYNLTICNRPKFIWFRNAKVGTRSILSALTEAEITLIAKQARKCRYIPLKYEDYFKFAFVRNPWDRIVSTWLNKIVTENRFGFPEKKRLRLLEFDDFVRFCSKQDLESCNIHFRAQSSLIDLNNVNFIGRFERFETDLKTVFSMLRIPIKSIPHMNKSNQGSHYRDYYSTFSKNLVSEMYRKDIQLFGYSF